jgi:hypothetical protein
MSYPMGEVALKAVGLAAPVKPTNSTELLAALGYINQHRFELFDANRDGALTADEWLEMHFATYAIFNVRRDGRLTLEEYSQYFTGPSEHPFHGGSAPSAQEIASHFHRLDQGHKGYLTIEDFRGEALQNFQTNDANRDGHVTLQEINDTARSHQRR